MNFNLSHIKMCKSRNGYAMSAKFYINGIAVADFIDKGDGGLPSFYVYSNSEAKELFNTWEDALETLPEYYCSEYDMNLSIDKGMFIDLLHAAIVNKEDFKLLAA